LDYSIKNIFLRKVLTLRTIFLLALCVTFSATTRAQYLTGCSGSTINQNGYNIEYAVGEIAVTTIASPVNTVTQGLLQPNVKALNPECNIINASFQYFPNPTRGRLYLVGRHNWIDSYQVFAADGKLVRSEQFFNNEIKLDNLAAGLYMVRLLPGCDGNYKTLKIVKITE
jgi:Secretion system C-terminal sorting domain